MDTFFVCWWTVHTAPDKTKPTWKRVWQTFEQSKYKMQRHNFFVVQQSLEWNTVMQIGEDAAIIGRDMGWARPGCAQTRHCQSHLIVKAAPQLSSLFVHLQFSGKSGEKNSWEELMPFSFSFLKKKIKPWGVFFRNEADTLKCVRQGSDG